MIREATIDDLKGLVYLLEGFHKSAFPVEPSFNHVDLYNTLLDMVNGDGGILLLAEKEDQLIGVIGGLVFPWYFNKSELVGQELFWYMHPEHRKGTTGIKLLQALEKKAKEKGCRSFIMASEYTMNNHDYMETMYHRMGYSNHESYYIRKL